MLFENLEYPEIMTFMKKIKVLKYRTIIRVLAEHLYFLLLLF